MKFFVAHRALSRAIASGSLDWNDEHLKKILRGDEEYQGGSHQWIKENSFKKISRKFYFDFKGEPLWPGEFPLFSPFFLLEFPPSRPPSLPAVRQETRKRLGFC